MALALVAAGLPAAAQANAERPVAERPTRSKSATRSTPSSSTPAATTSSTTASIKGKITIPANVDPEHDDIYVDAYHFDPEAGVWDFEEIDGQWVELDVTGDGSFEITGLEAGRDYRLRVDVFVDGYLTGFYAGPGQQVVRLPEDGTSVRASATGVVFGPMPADRVYGSLSVPAGFAWGTQALFVQGRELDAEGNVAWFDYTWFDDTSTQYLIDVYPGSEVLLEVKDNAGRVVSGFYHAGAAGLVELRDHATPVAAGSRVDLVTGPSFAEPLLALVTAPQVHGSAVVGETLILTAGQWSPDGATLSHQWLRDGAEIPGATGSSLTLTAADAGSRIAVRETAGLSGFVGSSVTSAATDTVTTAPVDEDPGTEQPDDGDPGTEQPGDEQPSDENPALQVTTAPRLTGTARLGKSLRVTSGTWSAPEAKVAYQWLRAGKPIKGATKRAYKLKKKDVGKRLAVRVTAQVPGHDDGVWTSSAQKVKKAKATLKVKAKAVRASKRAKIVVRVKAGVVAKPRGVVRVKVAGTTVRVKLRAKDRGRVVVRLPRLAAGKHRVAVRYQPGAKTAKLATKATVKGVALRVR